MSDFADDPHLDAILRLVADAVDAPPARTDYSLAPTVVLDGWEIVTSILVEPGKILPLGPRAVVISRRDYERVRGRKVIPFGGSHGH